MTTTPSLLLGQKWGNDVALLQVRTDVETFKSKDKLGGRLAPLDRWASYNVYSS